VLTAWQEQQAFTAQREMLLAQGARVGRSKHKVRTKGRGDLRIASPVNFALTFVEEPIFTSGVALTGGNLVEHLYPLATVGVYQWKRDSRGMYVGAYVWVSVTAGLNDRYAGAQYLKLRQLEQAQKMLPPGTVNYYQMTQELAQVKAEVEANKYQLEHHLVFEGLAIRDINYEQMMAG
jgi:hypothetical protein